MVRNRHVKYRRLFVGCRDVHQKLGDTLRNIYIYISRHACRHASWVKCTWKQFKSVKLAGDMVRKNCTKMDLTKLATRLIFYKVNTHSHKIPSRKGPLRVMHERVSPPLFFFLLVFSFIYTWGWSAFSFSVSVRKQQKKINKRGMGELALNWIGYQSGTVMSEW